MKEKMTLHKKATQEREIEVSQVAGNIIFESDGWSSFSFNGLHQSPRSVERIMMSHKNQKLSPRCAGKPPARKVIPML